MSDALLLVMALVVKNEKDEYLLLKRSTEKYLGPDEWSVVGAYPIKPTENMREIAKRELFDEIGITKQVEDITEVADFVAEQEVGDKVLVGEVHVLTVDIPSSSEIKLNAEHTEHKWVNHNDLFLQEISPNIRRIFEVAIQS